MKFKINLLLTTFLIFVICFGWALSTNKDKIFVRQDAIDLEEYEPFKYFKEYIRPNLIKDNSTNTCMDKRDKSKMLKGRRVICFIFSSLILAVLFGGFMLLENKLFKNVERQMFTCDLANFSYNDMLNLSLQVNSLNHEIYRIKKVLAYNLSIETELLKILENVTNRYNEVKEKADYQRNLQKQCYNTILQIRFRMLKLHRDAYLLRFHAFQFIYAITVVTTFIWSYFYTPKFLNEKETAKIEMAVKFTFITVLCLHIFIIILTITLPTRPWISKKYILSDL